MAPRRDGASGVKKKPALALTSSSPSRTLSTFSGFDVKSVSRPWTAALSAKGKEREREVEHAAHGRQRDDRSTLWVDTYSPQSRSQLAVHKRKVEDVAGWLRDALHGNPVLRKYRRILCLSGPAGSGKSAVIRALASAEDLDFDVIEWVDESRQTMSATSHWDRGSRSSAAADTSDRQSRFSNFLSQSAHFSALTLSDTDVPPASVSGPSRSRRRVILVDDVPNLQYEPTRRAFHAALTAFVTAVHAENVPLVIALSESTPRFDDWDPSGRAATWNERNEETTSVWTVIPEGVRRHPAFANLAFNPIAPTLLRKAMLDVLANERKRGSRNLPAPTSAEAKECVDAVVAVSNGDIRSALHALQMMLQSKQRPGKRAANGKIKPRGHVPALAASGREASLAMFHALGRILYNKRVGDPGDDDDGEGPDDDAVHRIEQFELPSHLQHRARRRTRVDVEGLWRSMPMDASTLQVYLHQNYTQFCSDVDQCCELIDRISEAEILKTTHEEWLHALVSDHYGFQIATRGTLMALPSPVPRQGDQKLRGAAYFGYRRRLNAVRNTLGALSPSGEDDRPFVRSSLAEASLEDLAIEVLPIVARCRTLPPELQSCLLSLNGTPTIDHVGNDDDDDLADDPAEIPSTLSSEASQPPRPTVPFERAGHEDLFGVTEPIEDPNGSEESEIEDADS